MDDDGCVMIFIGPDIPAVPKTTPSAIVETTPAVYVPDIDDVDLFETDDEEDFGAADGDVEPPPSERGKEVVDPEPPQNEDQIILKVWRDAPEISGHPYVLEVSSKTTLETLRQRIADFASVGIDRLYLYHLVYVAGFSIGDIRYKDGRIGKLMSGEGRTLEMMGLKKAANIAFSIGTV